MQLVDEIVLFVRYPMLPEGRSLSFVGDTMVLFLSSFNKQQFNYDLSIRYL